VTWRRSKAIAAETPFADRLMAGNVVGMNFGQIKKQHFSRMASMRDE
jgi:hypothetical protein